MELTFIAFDKILKDNIAQQSFENNLFYSVWISEYLYTKYASHILELWKGEAGYEILTEAMSFLWDTIDNNYQVDQTTTAHFQLRLSEIDEDTILANDTNCEGVGELIASIEGALVYMEEKDAEFVAASAWSPFDVVDFVLTNELGLDTTNPITHMGHPLIQAEMDVQIKMMDHLKSQFRLNSEDRHLFR